MKETIEVALLKKSFQSLTALSVIITPVILLSYLSSLNHTEIFLSSITLKDLLLAISTIITLMLTFFLVVLYVPSWLLIFIQKTTPNNFVDYSFLFEVILKFYIFNTFYLSILNTITFFFIYYHYTLFGWAILVEMILFLVGGIVVNFILNGKKINLHFEFITKKKFGIEAFKYIILFPFVFDCLLFLSFTMISNYFVNLRQWYDSNNYLLFINYAFIQAIVTLFAIIPGSYYIHKSNGGDLLMQWWGVIVIIVSTLFIIDNIVPAHVLAIDSIIQFLGISDLEKKQTLVINEKEYPSALMDGELWEITKEPSRERFTISGYQMYFLGNVKLMCPTKVAMHYHKKQQDIKYPHKSVEEDVTLYDTNLCIPFSADKVKTIKYN